MLDIRRQRQLPSSSSQIQPPSSQTTSPPVIPHQAPPISLEFSQISTVPIHTVTSVTSKISSVNEHDLSLPDSKDKPPTLPCDAFFEESPSLLMKSSSNDNVSDNM